MENINIDKVKQNLKKRKSKIRSYVFVMKNRNTIDENDIQKKYKYLYVLRTDSRRNEEFCNEYFKYLKENLSNGKLKFEEVIDKVSELSGMVEASFSSKLLATINPDMAIWDKNVLWELKEEIEAFDKEKKYISIYKKGYKLKGATKEDRIKSAMIIYNQLEKILNDKVKNTIGKKYISIFDETFKEMFEGDKDMDYEISDIKKIDFVLWSLKKIGEKK